MSDAISALRAAVHARLTGDSALTDLLAGAPIRDEPARGAGGPYLLFQDWRGDDASSPEKSLMRHRFDIAVWSGQTGTTARALTIAARVATVLHDAALAPAGHRLIYLFCETTKSERDAKSRLPRVTLVFSALTEAA